MPGGLPSRMEEFVLEGEGRVETGDLLSDRRFLPIKYYRQAIDDKAIDDKV